ncbi:hypothetical protein EN784_00045 [bacterium M00.F.Ca.ET.141.01.1.1]|nr:hypothetical protein EN784_00045 [bacterium M00.F.Ca.ET.141.01.1.1]
MMIERPGKRAINLAFVILGWSRRAAACVMEAARRDFVILGRSKERSDAAQTLGSMPLLLSSATAQNDAPSAVPSKGNFLYCLHSLIDVTEWILGSARRFASLRPRMTSAKVVDLRFAPATLSPMGRGGRLAGEAS